MQAQTGAADVSGVNGVDCSGTREFSGVSVQQEPVAAPAPAALRPPVPRARRKWTAVDLLDCERARLGAEIHDGIGQEMTGFALLLSGLAVQARRQYPELASELIHLSRLAHRSVGSIRDLAYGMIPLDLKGGDLPQALRALARTSRATFGVRVTTYIDAQANRHAKGPIAEHLYRMIEQSIINAVEHAQATEITVTLFIESGRLVLDARDNGSPPPNRRYGSRGLGLRIMRYRARQLGATFEIGRVRNGGTRILCVAPLKLNTQPGVQVGSHKRAKRPTRR